MTAIDEYYPFDAGSGGNVMEDQWVKMAQHWRSNGVLPVGSNMAVSPNTGLVLNVATGAVWIMGAYGGITSTKTVTLTAAHATLPRIDLVVARRDAVANTVTVDVVTGTAAVTPTAPALTQVAGGVYEVALAQVAVAAAAVSVTADNITDLRALFETRQAPKPNPVRNASAQIASGGTSIACGTAGATTLDGWYGYRTGAVAGQTVSRVAGLTDNQGSGYAFRVQRDNGNSSTAVLHHLQSIPTVDSVRFAGRAVTVSFRARKGSGFSASGATLTASLYSGTGTDQALQSGFTGQATVATLAATLTANWQMFTVTATPAATTTELGLDFTFTPVGTGGASDYVDIKDVRLDEGTSPAPHTPEPYALEMQTPSAGAGITITGGVVAAKNRQQTSNPVRNASAQVWQRGTSIAVSGGTFTADGWYYAGHAASTVSRQVAGDTQGSAYCFRWQRNNGNASATNLVNYTTIPTVDSLRFAGRQVTMSFRARKGANYSASSDVLSALLYYGTGTDQSVHAGFTGQTLVSSVSATLTTSWQTFTFTATVNAASTELGLTFAWTPTGTAGAADYAEVKDVRIDEGAYAQEHVPNTYSYDLSDARQYLRVYGGVANIPVGWGSAWTGVYGGNASVHQLMFDTPMRAAPTNTQTGNWEVYHLTDGAADVTNGGGIVASASGGYLIEYRAAGNWTTGAGNAFLRPKDTSARLVLSAEI